MIYPNCRESTLKDTKTDAADTAEYCYVQAMNFRLFLLMVFTKIKNSVKIIVNPGVFGRLQITF